MPVITVMAMAMAACVPEKAIPDSLAPAADEVDITMNPMNPESRTYISYDSATGYYVPFWHKGDMLGLLVDSYSAGASLRGTLTNVYADGRQASFKGSTSLDAGEHTLYSIYPSSAYVSTTGAPLVTLSVPSYQAPESGSFDPAADILAGVPYSFTLESGKKSIVADDILFKRLVSVLRLTLSDETGSIGTEQLRAVKISSYDSLIAGDFTYNCINGEIYPVSEGANTITVDLSRQDITLGERCDVFVCLPPVDLVAGTTLRFVITTDGHEVTKMVSLPETISIKDGEMTAISLGVRSSDIIEKVYFADDFEWLQPYVATWLASNTKYNELSLDPVATGAASHQQPNIWKDLSSTVGADFTGRGYIDLNQSSQSLFMQHNYLKLGQTNYQTGIILPAIAFGSSPVKAELSFDWCAHKSSAGNVDICPLVVELSGAGTCESSSSSKSSVLVSTQEKGELAWQHASMVLDGVTNDTRISIRLDYNAPNGNPVFTNSGAHRWHLDNIKVQEYSGEAPERHSVWGRVTSSSGAGIAGVVVSDGYETTQTNSDGWYGLNSLKHHKYVFVSVPSGYEPLSDGILPVIHQQLVQQADIPERVDFRLKAVSGQENHTMLMIGDIHLAARNGDRSQFADFVSDINAYTSSHSGKMYALTLGDMTWDLYWLSNNYSFREYLVDANKIQNLLVYHTLGNHDASMYATGDYYTVKEYKEYIAPTYYSFNVGGVHYLVLDDVYTQNSTARTDSQGRIYYSRDYDAAIVSAQMRWLEKDLSYVSPDTPIVVAMHIPMDYQLGSHRLDNATELLNLLSRFPYVHFFTAHTHTTYNVDKLDSERYFEHNAGSVCGTWWWSAKLTPGVHLGPDGSPGGYTIFNVSGKEFSWQYKATGSDASYQFRSYDRNQIHLTTDKYVPSGSDAMKELFSPDIWGEESSDNEVYLNIWNWDPSWTIDIRENGQSLQCEAVKTKDPLHLIAHTAKRLNSNQSNFLSENTYHIFKVQASSPTSTLEIKVTDRFGNVYSETMTRPKTFDINTYKK